MSFLKPAIVLILILSFSELILALTPMTPYLSGPKLREKLLAGSAAYSYQKEFGKYISVPLNYDDPSAGTTSVYYFTRKPFDAKKPTFIFFQGGPGGSAHSNMIFDTLHTWNIIFMDYRGIAFSQPENSSDLKNPNYFNSEFTARDAKAALDDLGVKKASVYGHSYGTVVATIFASLFPDTVRAVVLEGTLFSGEESIWSSKRRQKILQRYFDTLPEDLRNKILQLSSRPGVSKSWFSRQALQFMYKSNFATNMTRSLKELFKLKEDALLAKVSRNPDQILQAPDTEHFSVHYFSQIACRELSAQAPHASFGFIFQDQKLVPDENELVKATCDDLNISPSQVRTYNAANYKVSSPVTYFQGTTDGATTANEAIHHFKQVPLGRAQIFIAKNSGHGPLQDMLMMDSAEKFVPGTLLAYALEGYIIKLEEFKKLRSDRLPNWTMTSK